MENYSLQIKKSAVQELEGIPKKDRQRVADRIQLLASNARPNGAEKLSGDDKYRVRQGVYRVLYEIDDQQRVVTIIKIAHRRDVYRQPR